MAMGRKRRRGRRGLGLLCILLLLLSAYLYSNLYLQTEHFTLSLPGLPQAFDGYRVVQLSDLHGRQFGQDNRRLLQAVQKQQPDLIVLTGDLVDAACSVDQEQSLVCGLVEIAPVYYVTGNHEWAAGFAPQLKQLLREAGVICLENQAVPLEKDGEQILLAGVEDPNGYAGQKSPQQLGQEIQEAYGDIFWILLAHRNVSYPEYAALGAGLILTGHAHGGIIRLPFTDGLIGPNREWFPTWTAGLYTDYATPMFVSRGLGNSPHWAWRLFNPPQLAVLELRML